VSLEKALKKRALDGHFLNVFKVPVSNCIAVQGVGEKTGRVTIKAYFENYRHSEGGKVIDVKMNANSCLVYFDDHQGWLFQTVRLILEEECAKPILFSLVHYHP